MKKILDVGCGRSKKVPKDEELVKGIDSVNLPGVDFVHDLEKFPWPIKKEEFDQIICNHVLEHLSNLTKTMDELSRILKKGGTISIKVPHFSFVGSYQDPTHKKFFTSGTMDYFTEDHGLNYYSKAKFKILSKKLVFNPRHKIRSSFFDFFINLNLGIYGRYFAWILPSEQLEIVLKKV